jgi:hypothetical protein
MTEIHFRSTGLRENQNSNLADQRLRSISGLRALRHFGHFGTSGFDSLGISRTYHFETPEDYFPKHLNRLPPVPLKIKDLCSLWAFCSGVILRVILDFRTPVSCRSELLLESPPLKDQNCLLLVFQAQNGLL